MIFSWNLLFPLSLFFQKDVLIVPSFKVWLIFVPLLYQGWLCVPCVLARWAAGGQEWSARPGVWPLPQDLQYGHLPCRPSGWGVGTAWVWRFFRDVWPSPVLFLVLVPVLVEFAEAEKEMGAGLSREVNSFNPSLGCHWKAQSDWTPASPGVWTGHFWSVWQGGGRVRAGPGPADSGEGMGSVPSGPAGLKPVIKAHIWILDPGCVRGTLSSTWWQLCSWWEV